MAKAFEDLRSFIQFLEEKDDLVRIKDEIDPVLEVNAIIDKLARTDGPAVLFENVKGSDMPILGNLYTAQRRVDWMLGTDDFEETVKDSVDRLAKVRKGEKDPCLPVEVSREEALCKEIVIEDDDIDLGIFPLVKLWPQDGGLYNTLPIIITKDPETSVYNVGIYRMMKLDKKSFCMHWLPRKHGRHHFEKAEKNGQTEFPVCIAMSAEPTLGLVGTFSISPPLDEYMVGSIMGEKPIKLTKAEDSDILVPASAEIIFEGVVKTDEMVDEGPFGESHGYYSPVKKMPVFHLKKITMKKDPIFHVATTGMPPTEIHTMSNAAERVSLYFLKFQFPNIVNFNLTRESGTLYTMIIALDKKEPNEAKKLIEAMWKSKGQTLYITNVIVVDGFVDVKNLGQVIWAWSCHCRPEHDVIISPVGDADFEKPSSYPIGIGGRMGIDATTKTSEEGYKREMPGLVKMDEEVNKKVDRLWKEYGFKN